MNTLLKSFALFINPVTTKRFIKSEVCLNSRRNIDSYSVSSRIKYHSDIEKEINAQICHEYEAGFKYLSFANHFGHIDISRKGCYKYFMRMYEEEIRHGNDFVKYQLLRGGTINLSPINTYTIQEKTIQEFFDTALQMEIDITKKLEKIIQIAERHNDVQCVDYIISQFIKEQVKSINEIGSIITKLRNIHNSKSGLYIFDLELEKSC